MTKFNNRNNYNLSEYRFSLYRFLSIFLILAISIIPAVEGRITHANLLTVAEGTEVGSTADVILETKDGTGKVYIEANLLSNKDTQFSVRIAKEIICKNYKFDCEKYDFYYTINTPSSYVAGPSGGAGFALLTYANLAEKDIPDDIAITGTINSGGFIGMVGGVKAKIAGARGAGLSKVFIPLSNKFLLEDNLAKINISVNESIAVNDSNNNINSSSKKITNNNNSANDNNNTIIIDGTDIVNEDSTTINDTIYSINNSGKKEENISEKNKTETRTNLVEYGSKIGIQVKEVGSIDEVLYDLFKVKPDSSEFAVPEYYSTIMKSIAEDICNRALALDIKINESYEDLILKNYSEYYDIIEDVVLENNETKLNNTSKAKNNNITSSVENIAAKYGVNLSICIKNISSNNNNNNNKLNNLTSNDESNADISENMDEDLSECIKINKDMSEEEIKIINEFKKKYFDFLRAKNDIPLTDKQNNTNQTDDKNISSENITSKINNTENSNIKNDTILVEITKPKIKRSELNVITNFSVNIKRAHDLINTSKSALERKDYYSAASYCFGATLQLRYLDFMNKNLSVLYNESFERLTFANSKQQKEFSSINQIQTYSVVKERLLDTETSLEQGRTAEKNQNYFGAVDKYAYAYERANTGIVWANFYSAPGTARKFDNNTLLNACEFVQKDAQELINYYKFYIPYKLASEETLAIAEQLKQKRDYAGCIHFSLKSKAETGIMAGAMGASEEDLKQLSGVKQEIAKRIIAKQVREGNFPIIGYSYLEYGNSLYIENPTATLLYFEMAQELSNLDVFLEDHKKSEDNFWTNYILCVVPALISVILVLKIIGRKKLN